MQMKSLFVVIIGLCLAWPAASRAEDQAPDPLEMGFVEAEGGWGFQLGNAPYLPDGAPTRYKHPVVTGWSAGATAGWLVAHDVAVVASYQYRTATSREGNITGVLDRTQGKIHYHTVAVGGRMYRALGPGRLRGEFAVALVLPFEVTVESDYGPALAPAGITGTGTVTDKYNLGYGAQAQVGYEVPVASFEFGNVYVAAAFELRAFQSSNHGRETQLDNAVTDLSAMPPTATTATIQHENGAAVPSAYAVSDGTLRLAVGARF
jgi:hypothetical protein